MSAAMHRKLQPTGKGGNPIVESVQRRRQSEDELRRHLREKAEIAEKGSVAKRIILFVAMLLLFGIPVVVVQYWASLEKGLMQNTLLQWVNTLTLMMLVLVGGGLLAASIVHGFKSFLLVVCLPAVSLTAIFMLDPPLIGLAAFFVSQIYVCWFVVRRVQYWSFKGLFLAYLITVWVTGPLLLIPVPRSMYASYAKQIAKIVDSLEEYAYE